MSAPVLIAGVGNVFFADDGFGVEVVRRLAEEALPADVEVTDFGIGGLQLALRLLDPLRLAVIVDALPRGGAPGALYVVEPALDAAPEGTGGGAHAMDVGAVLATARAMGGKLPRILIVGCEPGAIQARMGLGDAVEAAVGPAVRLVRELVDRALMGDVAPVEEARS
ncbi:hydrogenase maturation protease [Anaeromyxobacter oryzae]|uniref:Peptidase M52 n=1 Tax=Anaeromyxobacter oryzae TaxID=2918170 RepID=A0ABN6MKA2_9BACT|nr:hydrogenase maturation protease [Anaeromyxobacter oryzae]BDG01370.1 peptidase M52 [Anaeromyxobacter oryzae]